MRTWASAHTPAGKHTAQQTRRHRHNRHAGTGTCTCIHTHRHNRHAGTCTCTCIHTRRHTRPLMAAPPCPFQSLLRQCRAVGRGIGGQPRRASAESRCGVHPHTAVRCVAAIHTAVPPSAAALASFGGLSVRRAVSALFGATRNCCQQNSSNHQPRARLVPVQALAPLPVL